MSIEFVQKAGEGKMVYVLLPLLILHLVLLSVQIEDQSGTLLFNRWILSIEAPFLNMSSGATSGAARIWQNYIWLRGVRDENSKLQQTVQQLSLQNVASEQLRLENVRLRNLLMLTETLPFKTVAARVIGRTPDYLAKVIYVDRGSSDGIRLDDPVVSGSGIVGRVAVVARRESQIQLITNPDASSGAMVDRTRSPGVLKGSGDALLDLNYISNTEQVDIGDIIVSSGLDGIYPKGLYLGKVIESQKGNTVFRTIKVEPGVDLMRLEEVSVLIGRTWTNKDSGALSENKP
jgi:rod shape-determining protein MreC